MSDTLMKISFGACLIIVFSLFIMIDIKNYERGILDDLRQDSRKRKMKSYVKELPELESLFNLYNSDDHIEYVEFESFCKECLKLRGSK